MFRMVSDASKWLLMFSLAVAAGACVVGGGEEARDEGFADDKNADREDARIVGGVDANVADYPWQISMQTTTGFHFCGGSILNENWIISANHCVDGTAASSIRIVAGISKLSQAASGQTREVAEIIMYPDYTSPENGKDVSLLRLATPLDLSSPNVSAIELVTAADTALTNPGAIATVSGWGTLSSNGNSPDTLQKVDVPLISNADADRAYKNESITDDQIAAGYLGVGGRDSCQGDSGGPLVVANADRSGFVLAGVVSWGYGCADPNYPGMYARVSSFADWILATAGDAGGGDNGGGEPTPPATDVVLDEQGLSGGRGEWLDFTIEVPAGTGSFDAVMSGGDGDGDLYVRFDKLPTTRRYDCRSYRSTNDEACTIEAPAAGVWNVSVRGYSTFSGANLTVRLNP